MYSGIIYDTLKFDLAVDNFVLDSGIKPIFPTSICGPAFTCQGEFVRRKEDIDDLIRIKMFKDMRPGQIQVISSGDYKQVAQFGDISAKIAAKHGAIGAVLDGPIRDKRLITELGFPVFCDGFMPIDAYGSWQITKYQVPIYIGKVLINPGDFLFCDDDGVLVIPKNLFEKVMNLANKRLEKENKIREEINKTDIINIYNDLGRW